MKILVIILFLFLGSCSMSNEELIIEYRKCEDADCEAHPITDVLGNIWAVRCYPKVK
jgi:hypothetical protein